MELKNRSYGLVLLDNRHHLWHLLFIIKIWSACFIMRYSILIITNVLEIYVHLIIWFLRFSHACKFDSQRELRKVGSFDSNYNVSVQGDAVKNLL